jgi:hypothetical protein
VEVCKPLTICGDSNSRTLFAGCTFEATMVTPLLSHQKSSSLLDVSKVSWMLLLTAVSPS